MYAFTALILESYINATTRQNNHNVQLGGLGDSVKVLESVHGDTEPCWLQLSWKLLKDVRDEVYIEQITGQCGSIHARFNFGCQGSA